MTGGEGKIMLLVISSSSSSSSSFIYLEVSKLKMKRFEVTLSDG